MRMLGVQITLSLNWNGQVKKIIKKVQESVIKLINTTLIVYQVFIYFNIYLKPSTYYGSRII